MIILFKLQVIFFVQNEKVTESTTVNEVLVAFYFWMQNRMQYYERNYDRLQDVLGNIGGISSIVTILALIINFLVNEYITIIDTEDLILDTDEKNFGNMQESDITKKPTFFRKLNNVSNPPRRQNNNYNYNNDYSNSRESANYLKLMREGVDITKNSSGARDEKNEQYKKLYLKKSNLLNSYFQKDNNVINVRNKQVNFQKYERNQINEYSNNYQQYLCRNLGIKYCRNNVNNYQQGPTIEIGTIAGNNRTNIDMISTTKKDDNRPLEKSNLNFCHYLKYVVCCFRNNDRISYYDDFRKEMISEESFMQNQLDIYKLKKVFEENNQVGNNIQTKKVKFNV